MESKKITGDSGCKILVQQWNRILLASSDVYYASQLIKLSLAAEGLQLKYPLLCFAIITYCKPFTTSLINNKKERCLLDPEWCPKNVYDSTHNEMIKLRHQLLAHTDYDIKEPKTQVQYTRGKATPQGVIVKGYYAEDLVKRTAIFEDRIEKTLTVLENLKK